MPYVNELRTLNFRISDIDGAPFPGRALSDLTVIFTRDNQPCFDPVTLTDLGDGRYLFQYVPSAPGHDYIDLYDAGNDVRIMDADDIGELDPSTTNTVRLHQDYGGVGALVPLIVPDPQNYTLYVFLSLDWQRGLQTGASALAATGLDAQGNWLISPLTVISGMYHIVLINAAGNKVVLRPFLQV